MRKGIILAGGKGTRLYPSTVATSKQMLPIYDKPMVFYPLTTLMLAGIKDILIISTPNDLCLYKKLFHDFSELGLNIDFAEQKEPDGVASALLIADVFLNGESCALILGDNLFYGHDFSQTLTLANESNQSTILAYPVTDPHRYGIVEFDKSQSIITLTEKPQIPKSRYAVTGLYFLDEDAPSKASKISKSSRGELEIIDVLNLYLNEGKLGLEIMGRGEAWLDAGTHETLLDASLFVRTIERRQGMKIGCPEEVAWRKGWISDTELQDIASKISEPSYSKYLLELPTMLGNGE